MITLPWRGVRLSAPPLCSPEALRVRGPADCPDVLSGPGGGSGRSKHQSQAKGPSQVNLCLMFSFCKYRILCMRLSGKFLL